MSGGLPRPILPGESVNAGGSTEGRLLVVVRELLSIWQGVTYQAGKWASVWQPSAAGKAGPVRFQWSIENATSHPICESTAWRQQRRLASSPSSLPCAARARKCRDPYALHDAPALRPPSVSPDGHGQCCCASPAARRERNGQNGRSDGSRWEPDLTTHRSRCGPNSITDGSWWEPDAASD